MRNILEQYIIISRNQIPEDHDYASFNFHVLDQKIASKLDDAIYEIYIKNQPTVKIDHNVQKRIDELNQLKTLVETEYESKIVEVVNQFTAQPFYKRLFRKPYLKEIELRYDDILCSLNLEIDNLSRHVHIWQEKPHAAYNAYTQVINLLKKNGFRKHGPVPQYHTTKEENSYTTTLLESRVIEC